MIAAKPVLCLVALLFFTLFLMPVGILAEDEEAGGQAYNFSKEELTQMLAPIALYPDALVAQILMASTYPLEVVEADRWMRQHGQLTGNDLDSALLDKPWDPSVKSLCRFPDILAAMSDKLDQTRKLGDAFLGQEAEVMASVQELRRKAKDQGNLKTTAEQKVVVEQDAISIEPVGEEVVHVPVYDPAYVYGPWWYPAYPPYYWYYPPGYVYGGFIWFGPGIFIGYNTFSWARCDWSVHRVHVDYTRTARFQRHIDSRNVRGTYWQHNPVHRQGVAYRDWRTFNRFGPKATRVTPLSPERRGYPPARAPQVAPRSERQGVPQSRKLPVVIQGGGGGQNGNRSPQVGTERARPQRSVVHDTPFRGIGQGSLERKAGERGGISNRGMENIRQGSGSQGGGTSGVQQQRQGSSGSRGGGQGGGVLPGGGSRR